jgi:hypothetical protein
MSQTCHGTSGSDACLQSLSCTKPLQRAHLDFGANEAMRDAVVMRLDLDVIVDAVSGEFTTRLLLRPLWRQISADWLAMTRAYSLAL